MRDRFAIMLVIIIFAGTTIYLFVQTARRGNFSEPLSTYRSQAKGARALYLLAQKAGIRVVRRHSDLRDLADNFSRTLVMLEVSTISKAELSSLVKFVSNGGNLLLVRENKASSPKQSNANEETTVSLSNMQVADFWSSFYVEWIASEESSILRKWVPGLPSRYTEGVTTVETESSGYYVRPKGEPWLPLLVDSTNTYLSGAIYFPFGEGKVVFISSASFASNEFLARADNARFWINLLQVLAMQGRIVEFDEFHHGFTGERSISEYGARHGLHWAVLQLLLALWLAIAAGKRMGKTKILATEELSSKADYLLAMAYILKKSGHKSYVAHKLFQGLVNSMRSLTRVGPKANLQGITNALERQNQAHLARVLLQAENDLLRVKENEEKLLSFGKTCARIRKGIDGRRL